MKCLGVVLMFSLARLGEFRAIMNAAEDGDKGSADDASIGMRAVHRAKNALCFLPHSVA
eukprot:m.638414 g.638414  ORF g.638414 m.638414 type:complete len:59 (+) comp22605_c0_seq3:208-384(+)